MIVEKTLWSPWSIQKYISIVGIKYYFPTYRHPLLFHQECFETKHPWPANNKETITRLYNQTLFLCLL